MTMENTSSPLQDAAFMQAFLDAVIPARADRGLPGAGTLGLAPAIAATLETDPMFGPLVDAGLRVVRQAALDQNPGGLAAIAPSERLMAVQAQLGANPMMMAGISVHLYRAYYQLPEVLGAVGEPPRAPFPEGFELERTDPELLAILRSRALAKPTQGAH